MNTWVEFLASRVGVLSYEYNERVNEYESSYKFVGRQLIIACILKM